MLVQCTHCSARGNVRSQDPAKRFKCPKCGGVMTAVPADDRPTAAPPARPSKRTIRKTRRLHARRTKRRRKTSTVAVILAGVLVAGAIAGGLFVRAKLREPGPGAKALGLLPASTLAALSVEHVQRLGADLTGLRSGAPQKLKGAVEALRVRTEKWLAEALGVSPAEAQSIAARVRAVGVGVVAPTDKSSAVIVLLALDHTGPLDAMLRAKIPSVDEVGRVRIYRRTGKPTGHYVVKLGTVAAICRELGPVRRMADSFAKRGAGTLERVPEFTEARAAYARKGRGWFYLSAAAAKHTSEIPPVAGLTNTAPEARYAAGSVQLKNPGLVIGADVVLRDRPAEAEPLPPLSDRLLVLEAGSDKPAKPRLLKPTDPALAADPAFRSARAALPERASPVLFLRESTDSMKRRYAAEPAALLVGAVLEEQRASVTALVPNLAQALMAVASKRTKTAEPPPPSAIVERSRKNILELANLCRAYLKKDGGGVRYPRSFGDLVLESYITEKNRGLLRRPGDSRPIKRPGIPPTSYAMAFDAVRNHAFTKDTPGNLPMVWEIRAAHDGKRFVVYFDGTVRLEATPVAELIRKLRAGLARKPGGTFPRPPRAHTR